MKSKRKPINFIDKTRSHKKGKNQKRNNVFISFSGNGFLTQSTSKFHS